MTIQHDSEESESYIAGDYLAAMRDFALAKSIDALTLLNGSQISFEDLLNPPTRIPSENMNQIASNLFHALKSPYTGAVDLGLGMLISRHGLLGIAAQGAHNLMEAYGIVAQYFSTRTSAQEVELSSEGDQLKMRLISKGESRMKSEVRQFIDLSTLVSIVNCGHQVLKSVDELPGRSEIRMACEEPNDFPHARLSELVDVKFSRETMELRMPLSWMSHPLRSANSELTKAAEERCKHELRRMKPTDLVEEIRGRLQGSQGVMPTLDQMAQQLLMSSSTLKRRLNQQKTSFQALKAEERFELAKTLIVRGNSAESISSQLGFSDASNFTKAFKTWSGMTPRAFRESLP